MAREGLQTLFTDDDRQGLAYLKDYRVGQVTTHGHDRPIPGLLPSWREFAGTMHRDNVPIPPGGKWCFAEIRGAGEDHQHLVHRRAASGFQPGDRQAHPAGVAAQLEVHPRDLSLSPLLEFAKKRLDPDLF